MEQFKDYEIKIENREKIQKYITTWNTKYLNNYKYLQFPNTKTFKKTFGYNPKVSFPEIKCVQYVKGVKWCAGNDAAIYFYSKNNLSLADYESIHFSTFLAYLPILS